MGSLQERTEVPLAGKSKRKPPPGGDPDKPIQMLLGEIRDAILRLWDLFDHEFNGATGFRITIMSEVLNAAASPAPSDAGHACGMSSDPRRSPMPTPLPPGAALPPGSQYVLGVQPTGPSGRPGKLDGPLTVTTDQAEAVTVTPVWTADYSGAYEVRIPPPADRGQDIHVHLKDGADEDPSADVTLDVDGSSTVDNSNSLGITVNTEPIP